MFDNKKLLPSLTLGLTISAASMGVYAQQNEETKGDVETVNESVTLLEELIVTGTAGGSTMRRLDATFAISTLNEMDIKRYGPATAGDLTNAIPGIFTETAFGNAGVATRVRGLSVGDGNITSFALNGAPVFPVNALEAIEHGGLIRYDDTVERVEAVVAGTGAIFGQGQPGLTSNYVLKEGSDVTEGRLRYTTSDYDLQRVDALLSGQLADDLYYMIGGYVENSSDFRDAEFDSGEGRQLTINITKDLDNGKINFYTRNLDDSTAYELFRPVSQTLGEIPSFNASQDTFLSQSIRFHDVALNSSGDVRTYDLKDGRTTDLSISGLNAEFDFDNGWTVRNNMNYTSGSTGNVFLVPLVPLAANTDGPLGATFGGRAGVGGTATEISTGRVLAADEFVYGSNVWIQDTELESFSNDLSFNKRFGSHDMTFGLYVSNFDNSYYQNRGTSIYHTAESNAQLVELVQLDGTRTINGQSAIDAGRFAPVVTGTSEGDAQAIYISDNWAVTDQISVDLGLRYETFEISTTRDVCNFGSCNSVTLANGLDVPVNDGVIDQVNSYDDSEISWSIGSNWSLSNNSALFARIGEGHLMPQPQNVEGNPINEAGQLDQIELGYKLSTDSFDLFATIYQVEFTAPTLSSQQGAIVRNNSATEVTGLELDAEWRWDNFELDLVAGYIDAEFTASADPSIIGNEPQRTPDFTFRMSPSYRFDLSDNSELVVFGALQAFGERQANNSNTGNKIPSYETIDLGANLTMGSLEFSLRAKNITDEIGLTEGTPQNSTAITPFVVVVPGRTVQLSVGYNF